jgi:hypothetical protein
MFSYFGICCNFNIIFNSVVGPICGRNLHRQPIPFEASRRDASDDRIRNIYMYFPWNYEVLLNSSNWATGGPI